MSKAASLPLIQWTHLAEFLEETAERGRMAGATKAVCNGDGATAVLEVEFEDESRADVWIAAQRPSASFCAKVGVAVSVSDYPIDLAWIRELAVTVANGNWTEELWLDRHQRPTRSIAAIPLHGSTQTFDGTVGAGLLGWWKRTRKELRYSCWEVE
jgi:hypothetical protein